MLCVGDVDSRWAQSSGETAGTWSDPDLGGQTDSWNASSVWHQQAAAPIQPGEHTGNQVETHTYTQLISYQVGTLTHMGFCSKLCLSVCVIAFRNFSESNINLTLYTINEPWLYSVLWCSGVSAVSSEAPHILNKVPYPIWLMVRTHNE